ncbi:MAG: trigger factor [Firmicutes bacterium]|nr:trigger factor [Bacillota bacterium]
MSVKIIETKDNTTTFEWELPWEDFKVHENKAYLKERGHYRIDGFRKGKAPKHMIENYYGKGIFFEEALNIAIGDEYENLIKELDIKAIGYPHAEVITLEEGEPVVMKITTDIYPEIEIKKFKKLEIPKIEEEVTDDAVDAVLEQERHKNQRELIVDDRAAQVDDMVIIDFKGFKDGEAFQGGEGEDTELVLGSGSFIPGFEDQIIGHNIGDEFDVNVTFPESYHASDLAGKEAVFKTKLKGISQLELPELDDDFASEISEFDTLDEFKADVRKRLEEQLNESIAVRDENAAVQALVDMTDFVVPESIVHDQQHRELDDYKYNISQQGLDFKLFLQYTNQTEEDLMKQLKPIAEMKAKANLVLEQYAKDHEIEVNDEDREEAIKSAATGFNMDPDKFYEMAKSHDITFMDQGIRNKKVVEELMTLVERVEVKEETEEQEKEVKEEKKSKKKTTKKAAKSEDKEESEEKEKKSRKTKKKTEKEEKSEDKELEGDEE